MRALVRFCSRNGHDCFDLDLCDQHADILERAIIDDIRRGSSVFAKSVRVHIAEADGHDRRDFDLLHPEPGPTTVYFAKRHQFVKIGYATNVQSRLKSIAAGSGIITGMVAGPVKLIASIPGGKSKESKLHQRFRHIRIGGEWFLYNYEMQSFIAKLPEPVKTHR